MTRQYTPLFVSPLEETPQLAPPSLLFQTPPYAVPA